MNTPVYCFSALLLVGMPTVGSAIASNIAIAAPISLAQSMTPAQTVMSVLNENEIALQIIDGDFSFAGVMHRHYGNLYGASNRDVRVSYNRETGDVTVVDTETNDELYSYVYALDAVTGTGDAPLTRDPGPTPVTYTTVLNEDQIRIQISEGDFFYTGNLERINGETFVGQEGAIRVVYARDRGLITVINVVQHRDLYNYAYSDVD